jgi:hypothetical protein
MPAAAGSSAIPKRLPTVLDPDLLAVALFDDVAVSPVGNVSGVGNALTASAAGVAQHARAGPATWRRPPRPADGPPDGLGAGS